MRAHRAARAAEGKTASSPSQASTAGALMGLQQGDTQRAKHQSDRKESGTNGPWY